MRAAIRRFIPKGALATYHGMLASLAGGWFRHPTAEMIVVGVTGTSGKTTTALLLHSILESAGQPSAVATTALFAIREQLWSNATKMTMLGRFALQRFLRRARDAGCRVVIVETTSEGLAQNRHRGIEYDLALLTNLTPEHIESHGSFTAYQQAKERLFHELTLTRRKPDVPKTIVVNGDDPAAPAFLRHAADRYFAFTFRHRRVPGSDIVHAEQVQFSTSGSSFQLIHGNMKHPVSISLLGRINAENALAAATAAIALGVSMDAIAVGLKAVKRVPGRLETFRAGGVSVIVDYAFHPKAMEELYAVVKHLRHQRVIHVLGATGGGRDRSRRPVLGEMAGEFAEVVIVTNEDPYDEDPFAIMDQVLEGVLDVVGKHINENVFRIFDRGEAIRKAIALARSGDVVLVTGKGNEQAIVVKNGQKVPWDDRLAVRAALQQRFGTVAT